jgi:ATP-dependent DNA helicase RecQ
MILSYYAYRWKSICFQLPALYFWNYNSNITAYRLDEDQVDSLKANGIEACFISSQTSEQQVHIENLKNNKVKMVYVAPESLSYLENAFNQITISLIAIDEHIVFLLGDMTLDLPISI